MANVTLRFALTLPLPLPIYLGGGHADCLVIHSSEGNRNCLYCKFISEFICPVHSESEGPEGAVE